MCCLPRRDRVTDFRKNALFCWPEARDTSGIPSKLPTIYPNSARQLVCRMSEVVLVIFEAFGEAVSYRQ